MDDIKMSTCDVSRRDKNETKISENRNRSVMRPKSFHSRYRCTARLLYRDIARTVGSRSIRGPYQGNSSINYIGEMGDLERGNVKHYQSLIRRQPSDRALRNFSIWPLFRILLYRITYRLWLLRGMSVIRDNAKTKDYWILVR